MSNNIPLVVKKLLENNKEKLDTSGYIQFDKSIELKKSFIVSKQNEHFDLKWVDGLQLLPEGVKVWFSSENTTDIIWEYLHLIENENLINEIKKTLNNMLGNTITKDAYEYIKIERSMHERGLYIVRELLNEQNITKENPLVFDWKNGNAPCMVSDEFEDDVCDCYITKIYLDGDYIYADLHAYYLQEDVYGILLDNAQNVCWGDIMEFLMNEM
jgi:hypothetical protein